MLPQHPGGGGRFRLVPPGSPAGQDVLGVDDPVGVPLLGEEALAVLGELLVLRVPRDDGVEPGTPAVLLRAQDAPEPGTWQTQIDAIVGDAEPVEDKVTLNLPEIAENGNTVPMTFEIDAPMTADVYVKDVMVMADGNPSPDVAVFHFTPMSGKASASTRMRLAGTQNVVAVAQLSDGTAMMGKKQVKVTIGGCGG
jgi:sulfur-oxidizing protein SoxY